MRDGIILRGTAVERIILYGIQNLIPYAVVPYRRRPKVIKCKSSVVQSFSLFSFFTSLKVSPVLVPLKIDIFDFHSPRIQRIKVVPSNICSNIHLFCKTEMQN